MLGMAKNNKSINEPLLALEATLKNHLNPVKPDRDFVQQLGEHLEESPSLLQQRKAAVFLLTIAGGLVIGLAVFLIGRKLVNRAK